MILSGKTIRAWAHENGFNPRTVYAAIRGARKGVKSVAIMTAIHNQFGL